MSDDNQHNVESHRHRPKALILLAAVLFGEAVLLALLAGFLIYEVITDVSTSLASALAMVVLVVMASVALFAVGVGALNARPWMRAAALTWQVLQIAVAVGSFQGLFSRTDIGWILLVPAIIVIVLLFTKSVIAATARE